MRSLMSMQLRQARRYPEVHPGAGCLEQMQAAVELLAHKAGRCTAHDAHHPPHPLLTLASMLCMLCMGWPPSG